MNSLSPFLIINDWLNKENELGSSQANRIVLATASKDAIPHSRIVAIREITEKGILFFTQSGTKKVAEMNGNPNASMTLWLPMQQRQVVLDGLIQALSSDENKYYWETIPHDRQLRFAAYAPTSGKKIQSVDEIDRLYETLSYQFKDKKVPMSEFYCGYRLVPKTIYFYTLGIDTFSEIIQYTHENNHWITQMISP